MPASSWLIGSTYLDADANLTINGQPVWFASGHYYLRHSNAALSGTDYLEGRIQSEEPTAQLYLDEGRKVLLDPDGVNPVSITWNSLTNVRDFFGFTGNIGSTSSNVEADNISPFLWSPGYIATPETLLGTDGYVTNDSTTMVSADGGTVLHDQHYTQVHQDLRWTDILAERMRSATAGGGTFHEFYEQCLKIGYSCRLYQELTEVDGSTVEMTFDDASTNSFGPYVLRRRNPRWYDRVVAYADLHSPLTLQLMQVDEYT